MGYHNGLKFLSFYRELVAIDCEPGGTRWIERISNWNRTKTIPVIPVLLLDIIDKTPIDLGMRCGTAGEYVRRWDAPFLRN